MKDYYDRFGSPKEKQARKDDTEMFPFVMLIILLLGAILGVTSCTSTAHTCQAYDVQGKYTNR